jgi:hypothetical protein
LLLINHRGDGQAILLDTASATPVANEQSTQIQHPLATQALEAKAQRDAVLRASSHPRYNCHGLTFASRRTAILPDAEVSKILKEDGYQRIDVRDVLPGDVAVYHDAQGGIDHSGIVFTRPSDSLGIPMIVSKWGVIGPEVYHSATVVPEYAIADIRYYRCQP